MSTIKERLYKIAEFEGLSVRAFEERCGLGRGNISNMSPNGAIGSDKLSKILDTFPYVDINWILTGKENKPVDSPDNADNNTVMLEKLLKQAEEIGQLREQLAQARRELDQLKSGKNVNTIAQGHTQTVPAVAP